MELSSAVHGESEDEGAAAERSESRAATDDTYRAQFAAWLGGMGDEAKQLAFLLEREEASAPLRRFAADSLNQLLHMADMLPEGTEALGYLETSFAFRLLAAEMSEAAYSAPRLPKPRLPRPQPVEAAPTQVEPAQAAELPEAEPVAAAADADGPVDGQGSVSEDRSLRAERADAERADAEPLAAEEGEGLAADAMAAEPGEADVAAGDATAGDATAGDATAGDVAPHERTAVELPAGEPAAAEAAELSEGEGSESEGSAAGLSEAEGPGSEPSAAGAGEGEPSDAAAVEAVPPEAVPPEAVPPEAVPPEAVPPEAVPPEEEPEEEPERAQASDPSYAIARRLAPQAALVRAFLGAEDAERMRKLVQEQRSRASRGRSSKDILLQSEARAAAASDAREWAELYEAPAFGTTQHDLLRLRTFMKTRVRRGAS